MISFLAVIELCIHIVQCSHCTLILFNAQIDFSETGLWYKNYSCGQISDGGKKPPNQKVCGYAVFVCVKVRKGGWGSYNTYINISALINQKV